MKAIIAISSLLLVGCVTTTTTTTAPDGTVTVIRVTEPVPGAVETGAVILVDQLSDK